MGPIMTAQELTTEQAIALAERWPDPRLLCVVSLADSDALRGWLRRRMDNAARTAAPFLDCQKAVWILDVATALGLSLVDAEKLCEWAGWPS